jgi:hypothetical protein
MVIPDLIRSNVTFLQQTDESVESQLKAIRLSRRKQKERSRARLSPKLGRVFYFSAAKVQSLFQKLLQFESKAATRNPRKRKSIQHGVSIVLFCY